MAASDKPKILKVTSLQLTIFLFSSLSRFSFDKIFNWLSTLQTKDSSKKPCSIPK